MLSWVSSFIFLKNYKNWKSINGVSLGFEPGQQNEGPLQLIIATKSIAKTIEPMICELSFVLEQVFHCAKPPAMLVLKSSQSDDPGRAFRLTRGVRGRWSLRPQRRTSCRCPWGEHRQARHGSSGDQDLESKQAIVCIHFIWRSGPAIKAWKHVQKQELKNGNVWNAKSCLHFIWRSGPVFTFKMADHYRSHSCRVEKIWQNVDSLFLIWQNAEQTLANVWHDWANFHCCKWPNIEKKSKQFMVWPLKIRVTFGPLLSIDIKKESLLDPRLEGSVASDRGDRGRVDHQQAMLLKWKRKFGPGLPRSR